MIPTHIDTWQMTRPGELLRTQVPMPTLRSGDAVVKISGCGVCHTDLSYFYLGVPTIQEPPLSLGHEVSGIVIGGEPSMIGKEVIVPAVIPCGECELCSSGRGNRCLSQQMPGYSMGIYGGFSSHIVVPAKFLCLADNHGDVPLSHLCAVADAVTTPYQAALRARLAPGDLAIVIGATGGIGSFMTQVAKAMGCRAVIAIGRNEEKLAKIRRYGADFTINLSGLSPRDVKDQLRQFCNDNGLCSTHGWKIFEATGTKDGQDLALSLLSYTGTLVVLGYGTDKTTYMLSRLMAFDAEIIGTWGCPPEKYPEVLEMCIDGRVSLEPFVEERPMSEIAQVFEQAHRGDLRRRVILIPDF